MGTSSDPQTPRGFVYRSRRSSFRTPWGIYYSSTGGNAEISMGEGPNGGWYKGQTNYFKPEEVLQEDLNGTC